MWELSQNQMQIAGTARLLAQKRGASPEHGFERQDHELAVALWREALLAGEEPPEDPDLRELTAEERRFVSSFLPPKR